MSNLSKLSPSRRIFRAFGFATICFAAVFGFNMALAESDAHRSQSIVTYAIENEGGGLQDNIPATFGAVFARGDVPPGTSVIASDEAGHSLPMQVDVKARHPDGSLRHAVLTVVVPHLSDHGETRVSLARGAEVASAPLSLSDLPKDFDTTVTFNSNGKVLVASARDLLAHEKPQLWLSGSNVTEWWVAGPARDTSGEADPYLSVRFGIRSYGKNRPVRIEVNVENTWTWLPAPRTEFYDVQIIANGRTLFAKAGVKQPAHTRWREVFWWNTPINVYVKSNLDYLKKTRIIPNYDPKVRISDSEIARYYGVFKSKDRSPMETGIIMHYMPTTGGRGDIGALPEWTVYYLLTMDPRAYEMMIVSGDLAGSYASHYRNEKTDRPTTTEEYPNISTHSNYVGRPGNLPLPDKGNYKTDITAQAPHEPSLAFIPYVITGERYYLEELEFWSQWNSWGTAPESHGLAKSLFDWDEVRAQAWSLRTLAQAAYIAPDSDPLKQTLLRELKANIEFYNSTYANNPDANVLHAAFRSSPQHIEFSPWMDDFLTWAAGYVVQLGFDDARPFARWKAYYPVQRMINPDYCWILATPYRMVVQNPDFSNVASWADAYKYTFLRFEKERVDPTSLKCGSEEMAEALHLHDAGEMIGGGRFSGGYPANLQPALAAAVDAGIPGAREAWDKLMVRPAQPPNGVDPQWAIVPWNDH